MSFLIMKRYIHLFPFLFIIGPLAWSWYWHGFYQNHDKLDKIEFCKTDRNSSALNYVGHTLISSSHDSLDQVLCPGDYFGDLNDTYVTVKNCHLEMYHKENLLWSSKPNSRYAESPEYTCAFSLQRDGNLILYQEAIILAHHAGQIRTAFAQWESQTSLNPLKTEVKIQNQQMQVIQAFKDGTERLFYVDRDHPIFSEYTTKPKKVANRFILKKSEDKDKTILRRNEYIGDLDGTHLILQTNCDLQLLNKNQILWSFAPQFRHEMNCILEFYDFFETRISGINNQNGRRNSDYQKIMTSHGYFNHYELEGTWISFEDNWPIIIQTLKNGTEFTFTGAGGSQNDGLKLQKNPRQLAEKTLNISTDTSKETFKMERMDYIGNLTDLHLILGHNCDLILVNGTQKLWKLQHKIGEDTFLECSIQFKRDGYLLFSNGDIMTLTTDYINRELVSEYQLILENNQLIVKLQFTNGPPNMYYAGPNTRGTLFRAIAEHSVIVNGSDKEDLILPKMGFVGDINGVYAMLEDDCNWVLYNKTEMIWESGSSRGDDDRYCVLILKRNGSVEVNYKWEHGRESYYWSTHNVTSHSEKEVLRTELMVNNDGLWLINTYIDGTGKRLKALERTNSFIDVSNE